MKQRAELTQEVYTILPDFIRRKIDNNCRFVYVLMPAAKQESWDRQYDTPVENEDIKVSGWKGLGEWVVSVGY